MGESRILTFGVRKPLLPSGRACNTCAPARAPGSDALPLGCGRWTAGLCAGARVQAAWNAGCCTHWIPSIARIRCLSASISHYLWLSMGFPPALPS